MDRAVVRSSLERLSDFLCTLGPITITKIWSTARFYSGRTDYFASYAPCESAAEITRLRNDIETAWGIIANAHGGDWEKATPEWRKAAERWRDEVWHRIALCGKTTPTAETT